MFLRYLIRQTFIVIFITSLIITSIKAEIIKKIEINGNQRISDDTIKMFSGFSVSEDISENDLNTVLKNIYDTNFFSDVSVSFNQNRLTIFVVEKPLIMNIEYKGIKANKLKNAISENRILKPRSSYDDISLKNDRENIIISLKSMGYFFSKVEASLENLDDNKVNLIYNIELGEKSKIKKISFIGNKIFKDNKLRSIIVSEEYKFWKFISGRKFLNQDMINLDKNLLRNFYLNKGYRNVEINSSFAKLVNNNEFELIFNINANNKIFFNNINVDLPSDYDDSNYQEIYDYFNTFKNKHYSFSKVEKIINKIELIALNEEYESINVAVEENFENDYLNLTFKIEPTKKYTVQKINILGNNITQESVIRNQLLIDEGDPFNEILYTKSINKIKSLNFFKDVYGDIEELDEFSKIININVEEKATGEISLGAGAGTSGTTVGFAIKENNFLGRGVQLQSSLTLTEETIKGQFSVENPNFKNMDRSIRLNIQALEMDRIGSFGYKSNKMGISTGTEFEYLDDLSLGLDFENFYEKITTDSTASTLQKSQEGNYWDTFLKINLDYDKRNQKFETNDGFRTYYSTSLPLLSDTNTFTNTLNYKIFAELYENNISTASFMFRTANSITGDNIKLSERLFVPTRKLRGFENGKIGPKDSSDFIGGNNLVAVNFNSTLPHILPNYQNLDFLIFLDAANVWGVDYSSSIDNSNSIRSSIGLGIDWYTPIGPLNFSFAQPITKESTDVTESFRFNLGTTF